MRTSIGMAIIIALAACQQKNAPPSHAASPPVPAPAIAPAKVQELMLSAGAIGPVAFGAPLPQVETKLGQALRLDQADNPECSYVAFAAVPKVRFMVEKGVITRADVEPEIANTAGVRVGDTEDQLKGKIPGLKPQAHKYVQGGHVFTVPGDSQTALLIETDGNKVTSIRAGLQPAVSYVEGCG